MLSKLFNNMKIKNKLFVFTVSILICIILVAAVSLYDEYQDQQYQLHLIEQTIYNNYDMNIKGQVDNIITLLDGVYKKYEAGELTLEEAKKLAADLVRDLRYSEEGYFWIDTIEGVNVVLLGSDVEGTNRYHYLDAKGTPIIKNFIDISMQSGEGYQNYWFPKANQTEPLMKRGYIKLYKPFDWIVGTGNYIDDINKEIADKRQSLNEAFRLRILTITTFFSFILICNVLFVFIISRNITTPLQETVNMANLIANGKLDVEFKSGVRERKDEVGQLAISIEKMKYAIKDLIDKLVDKAKQLELEKELFSTTLKSIGDGVISTDQYGKIVLMNTVSEDLTGWKQEEASGKSIEEIFKIVNEKTRVKCSCPVNRALKLKKLVKLEDNTLLITKTGNELPIEDSAAPIEDRRGLLIGAVLVFRDVTEKKDKQQKIEYLSYHDQLTGLYNRHFFEEEIKRLDVEQNLPISIAMIDVNGLKLTNDAFGHEAGDSILRGVSTVLKSECRSDDIISRIGGDEFVVLLPRTNHKEAETVVKRIYKAIENENMDNVVLSVSIGWETKSHPDENIN